MGKERERNRIKSRIDELPSEIIETINQRLSDVTYTYQEIADEVKKLGFEISRSSIGRYALRQNAVAKRLKDSYEKTKVLVQTVKENQDIEATDIAGSILMDALTQRIAMAEDEFDNMPLDKAGRLLVALQRSTVYKEKFKLEYRKGINDAVKVVKNELKKELINEPELFARIVELTERAAASLESVENG